MERGDAPGRAAGCSAGAMQRCAQRDESEDGVAEAMDREFIKDGGEVMDA